MNDFNRTVSEIVRSDYRTADVFKKYGINYCCNGQVMFADACASNNLDQTEVIRHLELSTRTIYVPNNLQFDQWKIDFLIDYIVNVHHAYLYQVLPALEETLVAFVRNHEKDFQGLIRILEVFESLSALVIAHNKHEEEIIFPYIKQIDNAYRRKETYGSLFVKTLRKPFTGVENEHKKISDLLHQLRFFTNQYNFPNDACTNHRVVFYKLQEFDNDLTQHKHLENNILFPKVMEMERELLQL